jgi:hypothetical protein
MREVWARNGQAILPTACDFHGKCRDLLHAANLQHGTDGFTSPPKEGVLRIFSRCEEHKSRKYATFPKKYS